MTELHYSTEALDPRLSRTARIFGRIALFCALAPMTTGLAIVLAYRLFDWDWLISAGMLLLPIGTLLFLLGIAFGVTWFVRKRSVARRLNIPCRWKPFLGLLLLLVANFPIAFFCIIVGGDMALETPVTVSILNETSADLTDVQVFGSWKHHSLGTIKPGDSAGASFKPWHAKSLRVQLKQAGASRDFNPPIPSKPANDFLKIHVKPGLDVENELIFSGRDSD